MKKLILILIALFIGVSAFSQDRTVTRTLGPEQTVYDYDGTSEDTIGTGNTEVAWQFNANKNTSLYYNAEVQFELDDDIGGTYQKDVVLEGRIFSTDSWTTLEEKADQDFTGSAGDAVTLDYNATTWDDSGGYSTDSLSFFRQYRLRIRDGSTVSGIDAGENVSLDYLYIKFYER